MGCVWVFIFNLVDITKLPCYTHRRSTTVSLETFSLKNSERLPDNHVNETVTTLQQLEIILPVLLIMNNLGVT